MTQAAPTTLPALRFGGGLRRAVLSVCSVAVWAASLFFLAAGISPGLGEPDDVQTSFRIAFLVVGAALAGLPVLLLVLPAQRQQRRLMHAVLAGTATAVIPPLPPFGQWSSPDRMFSRLRVRAYTASVPVLLVMIGSLITFGFVLDEPVAAVVFGVLGLIPAGFVWVAVTLPARLQQGVQAGLAADQCLPVKIDSHITLRPTPTQSSLSWFDAILPDGQHLVLRTPCHYAGRGAPRGVLEAADLVLVIGRGAHQGLLISASRPQDVIWLRGPVPMFRVPRDIQKAFAADFTDRPRPTTG